MTSVSRQRFLAARATIGGAVAVHILGCQPASHRQVTMPSEVAARQEALDNQFEALVLADLRRPFPSDAELAAVFNEHLDVFDQLIRMVHEDARLVRIAPDFTWTTQTAAWPRPESELGFTRERWDEYRQMFRSLQLKSGVLRRPDERPAVIYLLADTKGLVTGGSIKGYAWSDTALSPQCESLDTPPTSGARRGICFKPLRNDWYLYYEWD
jgi:hypothetical protein